MTILEQPAVERPIEYYDQEDDIYYVSFGTGEPSHVLELDDDDDVLIEVGMFSGMPTGFRVLNFKKTKLDSTEALTAKIDQVFKNALERFSSCSRVRETQIQQSFEKVFA